MNPGVALIEGVLAGLRPFLPFFVSLAVIGFALSFPMPGRGPISSRRDPWRSFKFAARTTVMERAGGQCEAGVLFGLLRCNSVAAEVDHVFPHSKGGPTVVSNGQALCRGHNRRKGSLTPPWWYVLGLEKRRRGYYPEGVDVRVVAIMSEAERAAREVWLANKGSTPGRARGRW